MRVPVAAFQHAARPRLSQMLRPPGPLCSAGSLPPGLPRADVTSVLFASSVASSDHVPTAPERECLVTAAPVMELFRARRRRRMADGGFEPVWDAQVDGQTLPGGAYISRSSVTAGSREPRSPRREGFSTQHPPWRNVAVVLHARQCGSMLTAVGIR